MKRLARTGAVALMVGVLAVPAVPGAATGEEGSGIPPFAASAASDGMRMTITIPGAPLSNNVADGGGPAAQAAVNSIGARRGFAALPDPGGAFLAGPGTAAGALGSYGINLPTEVPGYPLIAVAEYPGTTEQTTGGGPYLLKATSSASSASGTAEAGLRADESAAAWARSQAGVEQLADKVVSRAAFDAKSLSVGPVSIGTLTSTAEVTLDSTGQLTRAASLTIDGGKVGDTSFLVTSAGFVVGDTPVPVPFADGVDSLNQMLAPSKVKIAFLPQHETATGVIAPAFEITSPVPGRSGPSSGTMTFRFGGTVASIGTEASEAVVSAPDAAPGSAAADTSTPESSDPSSALPETAPAASASSSSSVRQPAGNPGPGLDDVVSGVEVSAEPESAGGTNAEATFPSAAIPQQTALAGAGRSSGGFDTNPIYLVVAIAAMAGFGCTRLIRTGGQWNS